MEEVKIFKEEMRRTLESHAHKARWWRTCKEGSGRDWASIDYLEGARAYANKQAVMYETLARDCGLIWARRGKGKESAVLSNDDLDLESIIGEPVD